MDSIFAISLGFALRLVVDATSRDSIGSSLVGLWEGAVLYHFLEKWPRSFDPYVGLGFRLLVDFLFTESVYRLAVVLLWTGLGFVLADVTPAFWYDKNLRRFYRHSRRYVRDFDWNSLKFPLPASAISRVRFYEFPPATAPNSTSPPAQSIPATQRRHSVPGNFPGYVYSPTASTGTSSPQPSSIPLRLPVAAPSLPPSVLRSASQPKASSSSSVSFDVNPATSQIGDDDDGGDGDSFVQLAAQDAPPPEPAPTSVTPLIIMPTPVPDLSRTLSGDPTSSTLTPGNIDLLPEIIEPRDENDPPPPFEEPAAVPSVAATGGATEPGAQPRVWSPEKLSVRNPDLSDAASARSSIISGGNRSSIIDRADLLRMQAMAEEKERDRLHAEHKRAFSEKRYPDAVRYKVEQEEANERAMNLHRRAAGRYFKGTCHYSSWRVLFMSGCVLRFFPCGYFCFLSRCFFFQRIIFSKRNARSTCIVCIPRRRRGGWRWRYVMRFWRVIRACALSVGEEGIQKEGYPF